ncbi:MAG: winged helix-turn-helix transcriptional regulator [Syntrophobacteraceae bacterium]
MCVRLYSEQEYLDRPLYTPPEIQRSNLAEVILRMLFLKLGRIQDFPFLDPPSPTAIKDGLAALRELGAIDEHHKLTRAGSMMARLPLDPRIARMLIEAKTERALEELMIIGAALSIQDPRERPLEREEEARRAQAVFRDAHGISGISQKMLTQQLRQMEEDDLVERKVYAEVPPRVEYSVTETGRSLKPILDEMHRWGERYRDLRSA